MPSIKLQEPVSRASSLGFQLSCDCWQDGHYTFYRNAVPFSFYTGTQPHPICGAILSLVLSPMGDV